MTEVFHQSTNNTIINQFKIIEDSIHSNDVNEILKNTEHCMNVDHLFTILAYCDENVIYQILLHRAGNFKKIYTGETLNKFYEKMLITVSPRGLEIFLVVVAFIGEDVVGELNCGERCKKIGEFKRHESTLNYMKQLW